MIQNKSKKLPKNTNAEGEYLSATAMSNHMEKKQAKKPKRNEIRQKKQSKGLEMQHKDYDSSLEDKTKNSKMIHNNQSMRAFSRESMNQQYQTYDLMAIIQPGNQTDSGMLYGKKQKVVSMQQDQKMLSLEVMKTAYDHW